MNESTIPDNEFLFNKVKDLELAAAPNPNYHPGAGEDYVESAMDYSDFAFGFTLDPDGDDTAEVQINAGEIDRITVDAAKIVVTDDYFVYVRRTIADDTMLIATAASVPDDDEDYKYYRLYQFTVTDSVASLKLACRPFDIEGVTIGTKTGDILSWDATEGVWEVIDGEDKVDGQLLQVSDADKLEFDWGRMKTI